VERLDQAHGGAAGPEEPGRGRQLELDLEIAELDGFQAALGMGDDFRRHGIGEP